MTRHSFEADLWLHAGEGGWHFLTLPTDVADEVADEVEGASGGDRPGFGSVRVTATIGGSTWSTSVFPDTRAASYVLPVKKEIRRREGLELGQQVEATIEVC